MRAQTPNRNRPKPLVWLWKLVPIAVFIFGWHLLVANDPRRVFFFGSPTRFWEELIGRVITGDLFRDMLATALEGIGGFVIGNIAGAIIGLALWHTPVIFKIVRPYIMALGTAPLFALAPIIVVWFGVGFFSKLVIATLSTLFVALMQAYKGAEEVDFRLIQVITSFGGDKSQVFRKVVVPASLVWVTSAFRLNVGLALLGAFLGEYISSERGLGHLILVAGGLYNIPLILVGVSMFVVLGWGLSWLVGIAEVPLNRAVVRWL